MPEQRLKRCTQSQGCAAYVFIPLGAMLLLGAFDMLKNATAPFIGPLAFGLLGGVCLLAGLKAVWIESSLGCAEATLLGKRVIPGKPFRVRFRQTFYQDAALEVIGSIALRSVVHQKAQSTDSVYDQVVDWRHDRDVRISAPGVLERIYEFTIPEHRLVSSAGPGKLSWVLKVRIPRGSGDELVEVFELPTSPAPVSLPPAGKPVAQEGAAGCRVVLVENDFINLKKLVRTLQSILPYLDTPQAYAHLARCPFTVLDSITLKEAEQVRFCLEEAGATVHVYQGETPIPRPKRHNLPLAAETVGTDAATLPLPSSKQVGATERTDAS